MNPGNFPNRKKVKQEEAAVRAASIADMTPQQRLAALDSKLGKGQGAARERARMLAKIEAAARKPKPKAEGPAEDELNPEERAKATEKKTQRRSKKN